MDEMIQTGKITVAGGPIDQKEIDGYVRHIEGKYPGQKLKYLKIKVDGDYADLSYELEAVPFERIRRITGYLIGTMDRWNDAKRAEERDRVKHGVSCC